MGAALLVCRLLLAGVFVLAGCAKLADLAGSRRAVVEFGAPERLAGVLAVLVPIAELAVGLALVPLFSARFGAIGALVLLGCFSVGIANALVRGRSPDCHCFGQVHAAPVGWRTLGRNFALLGAAGFVAVAGWDGAGVSATQWVTRVSGAWLVAILAGIVIVVLVSFQVWFSLQLLSQNGRTLGRLDALEVALGEIRAALGLAENGAIGGAPGELGHGLSGGGLPVGSVAPRFELEDVEGGRHSLDTLLGGGRRVMLVFSSAGCGPCEALMPALAAWQRERVGSLAIAVVASGEVESNRAKAAEHGLGLMLLQPDREVAEAYEAHGTPMAVVIGGDGVILSPTVGGSDAITTLVAQAARPPLDVRQVPSSNGHRNGLAPLPDSSRLGEPAPELVLEDLDGERVALQDLYGERTIALFWNPGCGFCQRMLPDLRALETDPPSRAPRIVVISSGDSESVRDQDIHSTVLIDADGEAMRAFGAGGTPMGVAVEHGRIASHLAAGADAVVELIRSKEPVV
jgi:peroxiredoxin/uncharacterized membrane protein YphA (DoxX/SURF4 family)